MQSKGFIKLIAGLLVLACVYQLSFTFKTWNVEKQAAEYAAQFPKEEQREMNKRFLDSIMDKPVYNLGFVKFTYEACKEKELNLGLDLKGGMNVVLEIQVEDVVKTMAGENRNNPNFKLALENTQKELQEHPAKNYIEVFAKEYQKIVGNEESLAANFNIFDQNNITDQQVIEKLKDLVESEVVSSYEILSKRIDNLGVVQPNIMRRPYSNRIMIELPGVQDPQRVRELLQSTAMLEFWLTYDAQKVYRPLQTADRLIAERLKAEKASEEKAEEKVEEKDGKLAELQEEVSTDEENYPLLSLLHTGIGGGGAVVGGALKADTATINNYLALPEVKALFPGDLKWMWGVKGKKMIAQGGQDVTLFELYTLKRAANTQGAALSDLTVTRAEAQIRENKAQSCVTMDMDFNSTRQWADLTGAHIHECVAIVLDNHVYSAPVVNQKIEGSSEISGDFTPQEAKNLASVLKSGKVKTPAKILQNTVVGPSLGQESINKGIFSFLVAFILVLLYMGLFYKFAGWMSDIALLLNVFLLMGVLVSFGAVLTLPGIAGIVLTMGMAVDANVIIFERIKEELRGGKGLSLAIKDGFSKAYSAIIDGNLTTIITGVVLFIFGTGPVQGFATTLIIGIITSFFCAVFITRILIEWVVAKRGNISFSRKWSENFLSHTHFDFIRARKISYIVASTLILISCISFVTRKFNSGTEFTGGRSYVILFDQTVDAETVRTKVDKAFKEKAGENAAGISTNVKQFDNDRAMQIVTQYKSNDTSEEATEDIERTIYEALKSLYKNELTFEEFRNTRDQENGITANDMIGPSIAYDMIWNSIYAVLFSLLAIGVYIVFRFKHWQWALGATGALAFNAIFVIGLFSLLYSIMPFSLEVNQAFIAAILTIIGYAINDTVVVFDRIREYLHLYPKRNFRENVNNAINSTLSRTINTSGTTLVTLLAIFFFGGDTIRGFVFALTVGVVVGTIATIFIATPIGYDLMKRKYAKTMKGQED